MIDRTRRRWAGNSPEDIHEYLRVNSGEPALDVKSLKCAACGGEVFFLRMDVGLPVIQLKCTACGGEKTAPQIPGSAGADAAKQLKCPVCKSGRQYNLAAGCIRRVNGSIKQLHIGSRCTGCGTLEVYLDWADSSSFPIEEAI